MPAHVWRPASGSGPGILLLQEIFGVSDYIISRAQDLADLGYVVLAPEIYWRIGASRIENGPDALEQAFALAQQVDWDAAVSDSAAALEELGRLPGVEGGTGIVGFCFGGALAFNVAAVTDPDVLVSYYGSSLPSMLDLAARRDGSLAVPLRAGGQLHRTRDGGAGPEGHSPPVRTSASRPTRAPTTPSTTRTSRCTTRRRRRWPGSARSRSSTGTCHRDDRPGGPRGPGAAGSAGWTTSSPGTARPSSPSSPGS